ncbi:glutamine synthetase family protein [Salinicola rhizosphaerae]|uniref:Glutamine synthetase n=1 Tax=Salinicola rhizosphaerae TaxID=1443141 RepID=A0ABQ3DPQ8_9GAMM|nr:glutamine synthetase family protein [Salinicola rhizosphaerae]GHB10942.1 glutamine synthetase [Salinicola rhizosphaerae]
MYDADSLKEAETFLDAHPNVQSVDLLISDLNGVLRGKRVPRENVLGVLESNMRLPASVFALDICGNTIEETGLGLASGDGDRTCRPVPGTLVQTPWARHANQAQMLMTMEEDDGTPFACDPRQLLRAVLSRFQAMALTPVIAVELEFYLIDRERDGVGAPQPPRSPATGERASQSQLYSMTELDEYADFLEDITLAARTQRLPIDTALKECAPGQFEVNLLHHADVLRACDEAVMLKRLIKGIAIQHGFEATFMAKPYSQEAGNGTHVHLSLLDAAGHNVFATADDSDLGSQQLQQAIAGLVELMPASMAVFAPNLNSYRRFQPSLYVPMAPTWGYDNRSVALRIPSGSPRARRIEHRVAGADANPYLLVAALLAGIEHGLKHGLTPPPPITGNAYEQIEPSLPISWPQALDAWADSREFIALFGETFHGVYHANRRAEYELSRQAISALEYRWYLRNT